MVFLNWATPDFIYTNDIQWTFLKLECKKKFFFSPILNSTPIQAKPMFFTTPWTLADILSQSNYSNQWKKKSN
jgi:hypothetical protein